MRRYKGIAVAAIAIAVSLALQVGSASAAPVVVTFVDRATNEGTALVTANAPPGTMTFSPSREVQQITIPNAVAASNLPTFSVFGLTDTDNPPGSFSDTVAFRTFSNSRFLQITFTSDPDTNSTLPEQKPYDMKDETGAILGDLIPPPKAITVNLDGGLEVRVESDVRPSPPEPGSEVPEPASLVILGIGMLGVLGFARSAGHRAAARNIASRDDFDGS